MNTRQVLSSGAHGSPAKSKTFDVNTNLLEEIFDSSICSYPLSGHLKPELQAMLEEFNKLKDDCVRVNEAGMLLAMKLLSEE